MKGRRSTARTILWSLGSIGFILAALQGVALVISFSFFRTTGRDKTDDWQSRRGQASGVAEAVELGKPAKSLDELLGAPIPELRSGEQAGCWAEWTDEEPILLPSGPGGGPKNGIEIVFWKAFTFHKKTTVGRYVGDLWTWTSAGTGASGFPSGGSHTGNHRLIERLPPPDSVPSGLRGILPGECVLGNLDEDKDRIVGRFWIELPAPRSVKLLVLGPREPDVLLKSRLTFDDLDVPEDYEEIGDPPLSEKRPNGRLKVSHPGYHKAIVYRIDPPGTIPPEKVRHKNYTLQVTWGTHISYACDPDFSPKNSCF
jgi:hypothetical protein